MKRIILAILLAASLTSCNKKDYSGLFVSSSPNVNERFASYMDYNATHPIPDIKLDNDEYSIFTVTDIHHREDDTRLGKFVSKCLADTAREHFILCLGDLVGGKDQFKNAYNELKPLYDNSWQFFTTTGNHDMYFGEWNKFVEYWPTSSYQFKVNTKSAGTDLFISIDSGDGTIGSSQRKWLEERLSEAQKVGYRHITVFTHTHFFARDHSQNLASNYALEETMDLLALFAKYNVDVVLTGHDHHFEHTRYRDVDYYTLNALVNDQSAYYISNFGKNITIECVL